MELQKLSEFKAPSWDTLPDIDLYMDQVLVLTDKYFGIFSDSDEGVVTSSMLNNYVKQKIVSPPDKKRYSKEHIASFLMICVLKRVLSMVQIKGLFDEFKEKRSICECYKIFECELGLCFSALLNKQPLTPPDDEECDCVLALKYAIRAFSLNAFAELYMRSPVYEEKDKKEKKEKKEKEKKPSNKDDVKD